MKFTTFCAQLLLLVGLAKGDVEPPTCEGGLIPFTIPPTPGLKIYYPNTWTDHSGPPPIFPDNFNCNYTVKVDQGYWAEVQITVLPKNDSEPKSLVMVIDQSGYTESLTAATNESFYFVAAGGGIQLSTGLAGSRFGFSIKWHLNPASFQPSQISLQINNSQPETLNALDPTLTVIQAETNVSAVVIPFVDPKSQHLLRGIIFYDGPNWNATCLGNALQLWKSEKQWVSTGKYLTVENLFGEVSNDTNKIQLVLQEYENTKSIGNWFGLPLLSSENKTLNGISAIITYNQDDRSTEVLKGLVGNGTVDVYTGGVMKSKENLIASYGANTSTNLLPQQFYGSIRTYVLNTPNSKATLSLTRDTSFSTTIDYGRKGFISSNHWKQPGQAQFAEALVQAPAGKSATFAFNIREADVVKNTKFNLTVSSGSTSVYSQLYDINNLPLDNLNITMIGDALKIHYDSGSDQNTGLYMDFQVLEVDSSTQFSILFSVFVSFVVYFFLISTVGRV